MSLTTYSLNSTYEHYAQSITSLSLPHYAWRQDKLSTLYECLQRIVSELNTTEDAWRATEFRPHSLLSTADRRSAAAANTATSYQYVVTSLVDRQRRIAEKYTHHLFYSVIQVLIHRLY